MGSQNTVETFGSWSEDEVILYGPSEDDNAIKTNNNNNVSLPGLTQTQPTQDEFSSMAAPESGKDQGKTAEIKGGTSLLLLPRRAERRRQRRERRQFHHSTTEPPQNYEAAWKKVQQEPGTDSAIYADNEGCATIELHPRNGHERQSTKEHDATFASLQSYFEQSETPDVGLQDDEEAPLTDDQSSPPSFDDPNQARVMKKVEQMEEKGEEEQNQPKQDEASARDEMNSHCENHTHDMEGSTSVDKLVPPNVIQEGDASLVTSPQQTAVDTMDRMLLKNKRLRHPPSSIDEDHLHPGEKDALKIEALLSRHKKKRIEASFTTPFNHSQPSAERGSSSSKSRNYINSASRTPAVEVTKAKSIVGTRPTHWGTPGQITAQRALPRSRKMMLSQATRMVGSQKSSLLSRGSLVGHRVVDASDRSMRQTGNGVRDGSNPVRDPKIQVQEVNFTPAFVRRSQSQSQSQDETQEEIVETTVRTEQNLVNPVRELIYSTPRPQRGTDETPFSGGSSGGSQAMRTTRTNPKAGGHLMKKLRAIRGSGEGDWVRFQSGSYPFVAEGQRRRDVNDPRNRASSHMDVTILSDTPLEWGKDRKQLYALCYVHSHVNSKKYQGHKHHNRPRSQWGEAAVSNEFNPHRAWIIFMLETVREQRIRKGIQLRIYNTIVVPGRTFTKSDLDSLPTILCTQLCEAYPVQVLPPLRSIESIGG